MATSRVELLWPRVVDGSCFDGADGGTFVGGIATARSRSSRVKVVRGNE